MALGRELKVVLDGDDEAKKWFKTWSAPNTLIDGSPLATEAFRLGNANQTVTALKRGYDSVIVHDSDTIDLSVTGVGELADGVYTEPFDANSTQYFVPEGTNLRVTVDEVHSTWEQVCVCGNISVESWPNSGTRVITSMKRTGLFYPDGLGYIIPGACCYSRDGSGALCNYSTTRLTHTFTGEGGTMYASPGILEEYDAPYNVGSCVTTWDGETPFSRELRYMMVTDPGIQHVMSLVSDGEGNLIGAQGPPFFGVGSVTATHENSPVNVEAVTVEKPTIEVEVEVEGNFVSAAIAGHFTFTGDNYDPARKYFTYGIAAGDPLFDRETEVLAITGVNHPGFKISRWKGTGPVYDADGTERMDVDLDAGDDEPDRWVTDDTIYVKCLDKNGETASRELTLSFRLDATFILMVDQPGDGGDKDSAEYTCKDDRDVGHTFFRIVVSKPGVLPVDLRYYCNTNIGFWPIHDLGFKQALGRNIRGKVEIPDDSHFGSFEMYTDYPIAGEKLLPVLRKVAEMHAAPPKYDLFDYNCTKVALDMATKAGASVPEGRGAFVLYNTAKDKRWTGGKGYSPGILGEELRETAHIRPAP